MVPSGVVPSGSDEGPQRSTPLLQQDQTPGDPSCLYVHLDPSGTHLTLNPGIEDSNSLNSTITVATLTPSSPPTRLEV